MLQIIAKNLMDTIYYYKQQVLLKHDQDLQDCDTENFVNSDIYEKYKLMQLIIEEKIQGKIPPDRRQTSWFKYLTQWVDITAI